MLTDKPCLTFISYSRADKEFALALATELKKSGFYIWLDQLDIPTGSRWDDEVQNALTSCDVFLIILTRNSVASSNVKDEINYALGKEKCIMPILLERVEIPFRLQRVQYVDFTSKSYAEGIEDAKRQLQKILAQFRPLRNLPHVKPLISTGSNLPPLHPTQLQTKVLEHTPKQKKGITRTISFFAGLAALFITCFVTLWFIWPKIPVLIDQRTGKLATEDIGSNTIFYPTTQVGLSPEPILATSSPPHTATLEPSQTATLIFTSSPTSTLTPAFTPSVTPFAPQEPDQFMNFYFDTIIYQKNFELGWSLLTNEFKANNNPAGYDEWKNTWGKVNEWTHPSWTVRYVTSTNVYVSSPEIWFRAASWYSLTNREFCVTRDESRNTWMIAAKAACGI